jgi:hypothetical protein
MVELELKEEFVGSRLSRKPSPIRQQYHVILKP